MVVSSSSEGLGAAIIRIVRIIDPACMFFVCSVRPAPRDRSRQAQGSTALTCGVCSRNRNHCILLKHDGRPNVSVWILGMSVEPTVSGELERLVRPIGGPVRVHPVAVTSRQADTALEACRRSFNCQDDDRAFVVGSLVLQVSASHSKSILLPPRTPGLDCNGRG